MSNAMSKTHGGGGFWHGVGVAIVISSQWICMRSSVKGEYALFKSWSRLGGHMIKGKGSKGRTWRQGSLRHLKGQGSTHFGQQKKAIIETAFCYALYLSWLRYCSKKWRAVWARLPPAPPPPPLPLPSPMQSGCGWGQWWRCIGAGRIGAYIVRLRIGKMWSEKESGRLKWQTQASKQANKQASKQASKQWAQIP